MATSGRLSNTIRELHRIMIAIHNSDGEGAAIACREHVQSAAAVAIATQALHRTQPGLPLKKGCCGTMMHDYERNGLRPRPSDRPHHRSSLSTRDAAGRQR
jgi:hypothetical protein